MPWEYIRWTMAERTGWTLEYIDALAVEDIHEAMNVWGWTAKARADNARYRR